VDVGEFESVKDVFKDLTSQEVGQIWAEAAEMYGHGEDLMLSREMEEIAYKVQAGHEEVNALGHAIYDYLETLLPESWVDKSIRQRQIYFEYLSQDGTGVYGSDDIHELGVNTRNKVCVLEIWIEGMGKKKGDITMMHSKIINDFMREMPGWEASKGNLQFGKYGQQRGFVRIQARIQYSLNE
jgi:putative DNA primase/helicase